MVNSPIQWPNTVLELKQKNVSLKNQRHCYRPTSFFWPKTKPCILNSTKEDISPGCLVPVSVSRLRPRYAPNPPFACLHFWLVFHPFHPLGLVHGIHRLPKVLGKEESMSDVSWFELCLSFLKPGRESWMNEPGRDLGVWICGFALFSGINLRVLSAASIGGPVWPLGTLITPWCMRGVWSRTCSRILDWQHSPCHLRYSSMNGLGN